MTDATHSDAEDRLFQLLQMVNEWLRFAEAKNAGLLALSGLSITAVLSFVAQSNRPHGWAAGFLLIGSIMWLAAALVATLSILPKTDPLTIISRLGGIPEESDNLFYYGHLAKLDAASLLAAYGISGDPPSPRARFEQNLARQVITNSRITADKLKLFGIGTYCWCSGVALITVGVLITLWG